MVSNNSLIVFKQTETGTTTPGQSGHWSNDNKKVDSTLPTVQELEPHYQMQFSFIFKTLSFFGEVFVGVFPLCKGFNPNSLRTEDKKRCEERNVQRWCIWEERERVQREECAKGRERKRKVGGRLIRWRKRKGKEGEGVDKMKKDKA